MIAGSANWVAQNDCEVPACGSKKRPDGAFHVRMDATKATK